ncbi:MAG: DUF4097 family beta strand repeat-containing protein [Eubacteriales bacterium]|nr:DUF4097 family beta strand repeat-containing protein [Eubacteriales bacterium]MDD3881833.1 DUF4097 family beta strand repeat-containing protein [Eubacteriales bacterium]MDD4512921.1 DUF4097 family beta strand repeat-containing protein [Eubacteriales bacterium]
MERNSRYSAAEIKEIQVHLAWAQLSAVTADIEDIQVLIAGDDRSVSEMQIAVKEGALTIEQPQFGLSLDVMQGKWMQVCLRMPEKYAGSIYMNTITGLITVRGIKAEKLGVETVNGDLRVTSVSAGEIKMGSVTGEICAGSLSGESLKIRAVNGKVDVEDAAFDMVKTSSVAGKQKLVFVRPFMTMEARSVSGKIHVYAASRQLHVITRSVKAQVKMKNIEDNEQAPELRLVTVSGRLEVDSALGIEK